MGISAGFDIRSLLHFDAPLARCECCLGIVGRSQREWLWSSDTQRCPVCAVEYLPDSMSMRDYLASRGLVLEHRNLVDHARSLAEVAQGMNSEYQPPLRTLNRALASARHFIHFISWGLDFQMLGALRLASERVEVRGVVSNAKGDLRMELTEFGREAPRLEIRPYPKSDWDGPHQKLVVIDGLLAFTGSANLTVKGWRKSAEGRDILDSVTDVLRVRDLNNRYFSPVWKELGKYHGPIVRVECPF